MEVRWIMTMAPSGSTSMLRTVMFGFIWTANMKMQKLAQKW